MQPTPPPRPRIGVFGGTFNPPHIAHLVAAAEARDALALDRVLLVVANEPWQKVGDRAVTPAAIRLEMVRAAVAGEGGLEASDLEIRRGGRSYTADTLTELHREHPEAELHLVLGADAASRLHTWERADEVAAGARIVVVDRPGEEVRVPDGFEFTRLEIPALDISSSWVRERVAAGRSVRHLVPAEVISLVAERRLYRERR